MNFLKRSLLDFLYWLEDVIDPNSKDYEMPEKHYEDAIGSPHLRMAQLPAAPEDGDYSHWCPFDLAQYGEYMVIKGFVGSCPNCVTGRFPQLIWGVYLRDDGNYHVFTPLFEYRCGSCNGLLGSFSVLCNQKPVDVTHEFMEHKK